MAKSTENFFTTPQRLTSAVKTRIVVDYFKRWASILWGVVKTNNQPRLRYVDLFAGPGKIDNVKSTPLLIMEHVISKAELAGCVGALLNDLYPDHIKQLEENLKELPGYESLKLPPRTRTACLSP